MSLLRRIRPGLIVLGVALAIGSLVGARALTAGSSNQNGKPSGEPKTANPLAVKASGPIVLGTVDSDPSPVEYRLPPVLQTGTVAAVFVKDGMEIRVGDKLYEFDSALPQTDLECARSVVAIARIKVDVAQEGAKAHARQVELAKQALLFAEEKEKLQGKNYNLIRSNLEQFWKNQKKPSEQPYTDIEIAKKLEDDPQLQKAHADYVFAVRDVSLKQKELAALEAADPQVYVREAHAGVKKAEADVNKAQTAIDLCTVKAKSAGTVERVTISPGTTLGIGTREAAMWVIPAGSRVIRAEIEADFAHRVKKDIEGKEVIVYDNTDPSLTYRGKVLRVGGAFLAKRSAGENMFGSDTRVLEALVEVADPAPVGKPPLRVGQRVRVNLGQ